MNINQLNNDQLEELAQSYLMEHYHEYNPDAAELEGPSYGELAAALDIVGRDTLMSEYDGITFYRGRTVTEYDGDVYEIVDRATHEPLFTAIPKEA